MIDAETDKPEGLCASTAQDNLAVAAAPPRRLSEDLGEAMERDPGVGLPSFTVSKDDEPKPLDQKPKSSLEYQNIDGNPQHGLDVLSPPSRATDTGKRTGSMPALRPKSTERKKRKGGNVIDDLFRGL